MQIQRPNDKVTSLLIAESDKWHFLRACKEINQSVKFKLIVHLSKMASQVFYVAFLVSTAR